MGITILKKFKTLLRPLAALAAWLYWAPVFAQVGTGFQGDNSGAICILASYYKELIGGVALIAGIIWFVGYVNKKETLTDLAQTVIIGCIVVGALSFLIQKTGLQLPLGC